MQNTSLHEFAVSMPSRTFSVSATYGSNPDLIMQLLAGRRRSAPVGAAEDVRSSANPPADHRRRGLPR